MSHLASSLVPSKVKNSPWVWSEPSIQTLMEDFDPNKIGKWMLFLNCQDRDEDGLTQLDNAWPLITSLVEQGVLIDAKCSTAYDNSSSLNGVIICYTDDYTKKDKVKKAADIIRGLVDYPMPMYYKADVAVSAGKSKVVNQQFGHKPISMYKHTKENQLYERDSMAQWTAAEYPEWA